MKKVVTAFFIQLLIFPLSEELRAQEQTFYALPIRVADSLILARNLHLDGYTARAKQIYNRYYQQYPAEKDILFGLALIAEEENDPLLALRYYNEIEAFNYSFPELYFNRGMIRYREQQYAGALEDFLIAGSMEGSETQSLSYKGIRYSEGAATQLIGIFTQNTWEEECSSWQIRCLMQMDKGEEALEIIRQKREGNPNHLPWLELEYETMMELGNKRGAVETLLKMVKLDPGNLTVAYNLISLQEELMTNRQKIQAYKDLLDVAPDFTEAALNLGIAYYREGKYEESKEMFDGILKNRPETGIAWYNRGLTQLKLKNPQAAESDFRKGLNLLSTDHAPSFGALGIALTELQKYASAIEALELAFSLDGKNSIYAFNLANAYYKKGDKNRACFYFKKSADLGQKEAFIMLGKICN